MKSIIKLLCTFLLLPLFITGCDFNKTFKAATDLLEVVIEIKGYTDFPYNKIKWYKDIAPDTIISLGDGKFKVIWENKPAGTHVGATIKKAIGAITNILEEIFSVTGHPQPVPVATPRYSIKDTEDKGRILEISNMSPTASVRIKKLQCATSITDIPLDNLTYYDPLVDGLNWFTVISTPLNLGPGMKYSIDIPDESLSHYVYSRSITSDLNNIVEEEIVQKSELPPIPLITEWGLIILAILILSTAVWVLMRRRARLSV
ncbi:MAG: hypothetical protein QME52_04365 [Bacteroidota bacterium]|nr:hypothetical protein [Bacteroidota bacterium]